MGSLPALLLFPCSPGWLWSFQGMERGETGGPEGLTHQGVYNLAWESLLGGGCPALLGGGELCGFASAPTPPSADHVQHAPTSGSLRADSLLGSPCPMARSPFVGNTHGCRPQALAPRWERVQPAGFADISSSAVGAANHPPPLECRCESGTISQQPQFPGHSQLAENPEVLT